MAYELQLDSFQGPLEVLYQLVKKNRIEISELSLASIAEQYIDYMQRLKEFNLELASEFMLIATELMQLKLRTLLPREDKEEVEEEEGRNLVERLQEYHYFKKVSEVLMGYEERGSSYFQRALELEYFIDEELEINLEMDLSDLQEAYKQAMAAYSNRSMGEEETVDREWQEIKFEDIRIEDKISFIIEKISRSSAVLKFSDLLLDKSNRLEIVVTLLGVLELARLAKVSIKQEEVFSTISIK
ncbi:MAG TPA: segregation/condensation protein A [Halanaerobiaceae bacterium]|jgi:segregation and condensation protein A|nr:segregation/condensation protein A [Bacillota bacterium]HHU93255.1 segregation/condensation protein A [Halanaerobiaceae bacterium]HOA40308.1 segregation/condensation protein A [Halanaerobiales bacterium]HPZ62324.1 segregation/condensation protein A [Halanaerobiales bacterium]HQD03200.1 segregation/condensation protein A [Halanaerobiales bacterium]